MGKVYEATKEYRKFRAKRHTAKSIARCGHGRIKPHGSMKHYFHMEGYPCTICPVCSSKDTG